MDETRVEDDGEDEKSLSDILNSAIEVAHTTREDTEVAPSSDEAKDSPIVQKDAPTETIKAAKTESETTPDNPFAPKHWTEAEKAAFAKAPPEVQQAINTLVKNLQKGFTQKAMAAAESRKFVEGVQTAFQPHHRSEMARYGLDEVSTVKELLKLQDHYTRDPIGYVKMVMRSKGITPQQLGFAQPPVDPYAPDPVGSTVSPEVAQMQSELAALKGVLQQAANTNVDRSTKLAEQVVLNFAHETDDSGNLTRPHFDSLQPQIAYILQNDPDIMDIEDAAERLGAAYDRAAWSHPTVRNELIARDEAAKRQTWETERSKNALSVKPRVGGAARRVEGRMSLEDSLSEAMRLHGQ